MLPNADKIKCLRQKAGNQGYDPKRVVSGFLYLIQQVLQSRDNAESDDISVSKKQLFFENWFRLKRIEIQNAGIETAGSSEDVRADILADNLTENMSAVALLNRFVYTVPDKHRLIVGKNFLRNGNETMRISSTIKKITTDSLKDRKGQSINLNINYVIPGIPAKNIRLEHEKVKISSLDSITYKRFPDILSAFEAAKKEFAGNTQTFIFGDDVEVGIKEYSRILRSKKRYKKLPGSAEYLANTLYSHLEALNDFVLYLRKREKTHGGAGKSVSAGRPNYCCGSHYCELADVCKSFIYFLGVRCSDENKFQLEQNKKMYDERTRGNGKGGKELFRIHLKPHTEPCYSNTLFLTLRIYFKWDNKEKKIAIGWLGRHLYLPLKCPPHMTSCWRWDKGCPANTTNVSQS
jgi:hypothetical protein